MLNSEKIFDMLPYVVDIYDKLNIDGYRKEVTKKYKKEADKGKKVEAMDVGMDVFKYILKNSNRVKEEFFAVVAIFEGKTVKEIKEQPFTKTAKTFMDIFSDKELTDFFKSAMQ